MDFVFELIFEIVLEGIFGLTIHNPKAKAWVKTLVFVLITQLLAGFFAFLALSIPPQDGNISCNLICGAAALALSVGFLIMAVYGHRRDWKQVDI